jgi:hypothetical protein
MKMAKLPVQEYPDDFKVVEFAWPAITPPQRGVIFLADRDMVIDGASFNVTVGVAANFLLKKAANGVTDLTAGGNPSLTDTLAMATSVGSNRVWNITNQVLKRGERLYYEGSAALTGVANLVIRVRMRSRKE